MVYLNEPNTDIEHETGQNDYLKFAAGSMQGWRLNMVSQHAAISADRNQPQITSTDCRALSTRCISLRVVIFTKDCGWICAKVASISFSIQKQLWFIVSYLVRFQSIFNMMGLVNELTGCSLLFSNCS